MVPKGYSIINDSNTIDGYIYVSFNYQMRKSTINIKQVESYKHTITNRIIQLIVIGEDENISKENLGEYVISSFDISLVKNYYNGKNLVITKLNDILQKTGYISENIKKACTYNITRFNQRTNIMSYFQLLTALQIRVLKYNSRGFHIHNEDICSHLFHQ
jgi:hypothetical protein